MESGKITISRAARQADFPAKFQLIAAMNPCPCGYLGDKERSCICSQSQIDRYKAKISGPLIDRIDMHVEVSRIPYKELRACHKTIESSIQVKQRVSYARNIQLVRNKGKTNAQLNTVEMEHVLNISEKNLVLLEKIVTQLKLSARAYHRVLKIARTIADLDDSKEILQNHLLEALTYRCLDRPS
jgi:magnesium chelatase family protein